MSAPRRATLSVIVPVGPGDDSWRTLLPDLAALPKDAELLLVAAPGQTPIDFMARAYALRCRTQWLQAPAGRAAQQNVGAAQAHGEVLWFVHADSRLSSATFAGLDRYLAAPHGLGFFDLRFLGDGPWAMRLNTLGAWIRSHWLRLPFGDQGFIIHADDFKRLGTFDINAEAGEDHALVWQARRFGVTLRALNVPLYTSARKYAGLGWWRVTWQHLVATWRQARRFSQPSPRNDASNQGGSWP
jgi:hypothetical protein